tara:strand:- start:15267 stop:16568 length:1302 start_codon:yes stop_codon:yes gene_type:complete
MLIPQEIIRKKRDGHSLSAREIEFFIDGLSSGSISEGQIAAFGMSVYFNGMSFAECAALTDAMARSGDMLEWDLEGPVLDKHSTGGVGDLVSLILGPVIAACGGYVPMISGRGLGHTGGTLDKLEAIPGYTTNIGVDRFREVVRDVGVAIIGQTGDLAPADKRFYAIRDVTATVESIPLITASILSKKIAAGLGALVMDVKSGNGAFMTSHDDACRLANSIQSVANELGLKQMSLVTDMSEPLAPCAGNALEVAEAVRFLTGESVDRRIMAIVKPLCAQLLCLGELANSISEAESQVDRVLANGEAAERFARMVHSLGGPSDFMEKPLSYLSSSPRMEQVSAPRSGYVASWDTRALGMAVVALGGGRMRPEQSIDPAVGLSDIVRIGTYVHAGDPLAVVHGPDQNMGEFSTIVQEAVCIEVEPPAPREDIYSC